MKCDLCSKPATFHVCEIRHGEKPEAHLCVEHVTETEFARAGLASSAPKPAAWWIVDKLKGIGGRPDKLKGIEGGPCDLCSKPATVHICEIHGGKREKHLCAEHVAATEFAGTSNLVPGQMILNGVICFSSKKAAYRGPLDNLRGTRNFLRQHGRMPKSVEELNEGMSLPDDGAVAEITDAETLQEFRRMDAMVRFIQTHGRLPGTKEEFKASGS